MDGGVIAMCEADSREQLDGLIRNLPIWQAGLIEYDLQELTPYPAPSATLLVGGAAIAFIPGAPAVRLDPALVLVLFLPPLLSDGAWFAEIARFRRHLAGILSLAIGAVLFSTLVIAAVAHLVMPALPWAAYAALGAILSPPDAVSARAVLARVLLPCRLNALIQGESLLNDATGLVTGQPLRKLLKADEDALRVYVRSVAPLGPLR